jgi:autotransporter-associated beta strand protein
MKIFPLFLAGMPVRVLSLCALISSLPPRAEAQVTTGFTGSAAGPYDYNDPANWVDGDINGIWDSSLTLTTGQAVTFGADTPLGTGLSFGYTGGSGVTLRADGSGPHTLTLGGNITVNPSGNATVNFGATALNQQLNVDLGGQTRTFVVASSRTLGFVNVISNGGLDIYGGTVNMSGLNTYTGDTRVFTGNLSLNGASGSVADSDVYVKSTNGTTSVTFNSNSGGGAVRAKSVTLDGAGSSGSATATLAVAGNSGANSLDAISGALTNGRGYGLVSVAANASRNARLNADSFIQNPGTVTYFRGTNLGKNAVASQTAGSANVTFTNAPSLSGGGGALGTTTVSILVGAYGAASTSDTNGEGLVTYDSTYGIRLLDTTSEYTSSITDGQTQLDNVRVVGATGANVTNTLSSNTTINSLSLIAPAVASGGAGVTITGSGTLTVASGAIFGSQSVTGGVVASDAMVISTGALNFNGQDASIIVARTNAQSSATNITNGPLEISSVITNATSLTKGGVGYLKLTGLEANTYTGDTTIVAGSLGLGKTNGVNAIGGDLVVNGGAVYWVGSNQIGDTADITMNSGSVNFRPSNNTGSSASETFGDLTMTGGSFSAGSSSNGTNLVTMNSATLSGGSMTLNRNNDVAVVAGMTISNGATVSVARAHSTSSAYDTTLTVGGNLTITNTDSGAYTPISIESGNSATNQGGRVNLNGDVLFVGNGTNNNTVTIAAPAGVGPRGVIALGGERTFTIGNGAAMVDLAVQADMINGGTDGELVKEGVGVLELSGANTYTGATTVNAGTLLLNGSSVSAVTVNGGVFGGTGTVSNSVSVGNDGTLAPGNSPGMLSTGELSLTGANATIAMEIGGIGAGLYDQLNVTGGVNLDGNGQIAITMLSYVPQPTDIFFLILNDDIDAISGTLFGIAQGGTFTSGGYSWMVSYTGDSAGGTFTGGNDLALQVVPEPSTWVLLTGGLMVATLLRRRRNV